MTSFPPDKTLNSAQDATEILGHPRGLTYLFATEMWERFSYYGMSSLLVLYMVNHLLDPARVDSVLGYRMVNGILEFLFGPLDIQPRASQLYGLYTGLVYLTPVVGGLMADRLLGQRRTVLLGAVLMAIGHFMMTVESLFLFALFALILGNGAFKPNITTQIGGLYSPEDRRRDRAYSIFYVGINLGAFLAPLVCGTLGEKAGWHYGFAAAGVGMLISIAIYLCGARYLPPDAVSRARTRRSKTPQRLDHAQWRAVSALMIVAALQMFFWAAYEQQGNTIVLWISDFTDRSISLGSWRTEIPTTWFLSFNPFMIFVFTPFIIALWARQSRRRTEPSAVSKMAIGCLTLAVAYLILAIAAAGVSPAGRTGWFWLIGYFAALTIGELYVSPIGLALVARVAPVPVLSMMMGLWLATSFGGNILAGWLGGFWNSMSKVDFFSMIAAVAAVTGIAIWTCNRPLAAILEE